jgi:glycosyltransferase involved in cell wall biosynthesis
MIVHKYYPTDIRVRRQAEALHAAGVEVEVICLRRPGEPAHAVTAGVHAHRVPLRLRADIGAIAQLLEYLAFFVLASITLAWRHLRKPYDVIQIHNLPDFLVFVALIPKLLGSRVILDLHDLMPEFFQSRFGGSFGRSLTGLVLLQEKLSCKFADHVITVTELWRQTLISRGVPAEQCSVVMNLADHHVDFISPLPVEELPPIIARADLGVVPYRDDVFTDTLLPTKLMEYAAMELPAVVARTSAISIYFDDTMVRFFPPGDAAELANCLLELHSDRRRLAQLAEGIQGFNQRYNWPKISQEYVTLVRRLGRSA